ncbi:hypothetical protein P389DRAFT_55459 [Cystobasidium minutum MCA 4210]|uniref:uncharacterized protein n=1 Tax=Cystobasidium minutum MCA 4210 TaxID=1397322 RepID=UPI0034CEB8C1|eukprot:jgi/Rhomi1/55459/CE55458_340
MRKQAAPSSSRILSFAALLPALARAIGDYTCEDTAQCATWSKDYPLSTNSTCVPDPLHPEYGYCGYVGAPCGTDADCDYGKCNSQNICSGYLGSPCTADLDCMAYFLCGTDGMCGGAGAQCLTGDEGCLSRSCSEPYGSSIPGVCSTPPTSGMPNGSGCSIASNCESRHCDSETYLCADRLALAPSQAARMRTKRDGSTSHNPKDRRGKMTSWFRSGAYCASGQTACTTVGGFECIDTDNALESCGGCPQIYDEESSGQATGIDCTSLPFVDEVYCQNGKCKIVSCISGTRLSDDGTSCIMRR